MSKIEKRVIYTDTKSNESYEKVTYVDSMIDEDGYRFWQRKMSVKIFLEQPLPSEFTWSDKGRINELRHYILKDNQLLVYKKNKTPMPITRVEMSKIFELKYNQTNSLVNKMLKLKVLKTVNFNNTDYFVFNPIYGMKSNKIPLTVYLWFKKDLDPYISSYTIEKIMRQIENLKNN